jgi:hypothetical protein
VPRAPTPDTSTAPSAPNPGCSIVPASLVKERLGVAVTEPTVSGAGNVAVCAYGTADQHRPVAAVQITSGSSAAAFAGNRQGFTSHGEPVTDIPGLADEAFLGSFTLGGATTNTLAARKGTFEVIISAGSPADALRSLMTAILGQL